MSELDALPADQRAVLALLLKQGQSYGDIASLLGLDEERVRARAHAALDELGPDAGRRLTAERRGEIADYLLGQQSGPQRLAAHEHLASSTGARAWARVVADALSPIAATPLPEIPSGGTEVDAEGPDDTFRARPARSARLGGPGAPSSRLGGALLLGGIGVLVAVVLAILLSGGGGKSKDTAKVSSVSTTATQASTTGQQPQPIAQVNLFPPQGGSRSVGLAQVFAQGANKLLVVAGQGLKPGAYALWLYTSPTQSRLLGFVPSRVGANGRFVTQGALPADARNFAQLVVTSEQAPRTGGALPKQPGPIVLQGRLQVG